MSNARKIKEKCHCMIVHAYYPIGETRVEREALALVDAGISVDVICLQLKDQLPFETIDGVDIYRLPVRRNRSGGFANQLLEYLKFLMHVFFRLFTLYPQKKYQTIQSHNLPDFLIFSAILPKLFGARLILDIHDLMPEFFANKTKRSMNSFLVRLVILQEQLSCRLADHVITVTDLWKERLIERGVRKDKVSVVMNVADDRHFYPAEVRSNDHVSPDRINLIYHGTFKEHYGMRELIQSINLARQVVPGVHLTLQGVGEYYGEMEKLVEELELADQVTINNFAIPVYDLPALINQADMGVIPNRNDPFSGELLPTKMLEYIALGKPVIAARTRVISHYFDETMVQFFEPGDPESLSEAIIYACRHWEEIVDRTENYHRFTSIYHWKSISKNYVDLIQSLAS